MSLLLPLVEDGLKSICLLYFGQGTRTSCNIFCPVVVGMKITQAGKARQSKQEMVWYKVSIVKIVVNSVARFDSGLNL